MTPQRRVKYGECEGLVRQAIPGTGAAISILEIHREIGRMGVKVSRTHIWRVLQRMVELGEVEWCPVKAFTGDGYRRAA